mmetsp:Transcript_42229/g.106528  ORF Transcript_42229/g.106528 Transcript_42229/m.106528 type:complete len:258 (-) Transcript_42229:2657-3430(-)
MRRRTGSTRILTRWSNRAAATRVAEHTMSTSGSLFSLTTAYSVSKEKRTVRAPVAAGGSLPVGPVDVEAPPPAGGTPLALAPLSAPADADIGSLFPVSISVGPRTLASVDAAVFQYGTRRERQSACVPSVLAGGVDTSTTLAPCTVKRRRCRWGLHSPATNQSCWYSTPCSRTSRWWHAGRGGAALAPSGRAMRGALGGCGRGCTAPRIRATPTLEVLEKTVADGSGLGADGVKSFSVRSTTTRAATSTSRRLQEGG